MLSRQPGAVQEDHGLSANIVAAHDQLTAPSARKEEGIWVLVRSHLLSFLPPYSDTRFLPSHAGHDLALGILAISASLPSFYPSVFSVHFSPLPFSSLFSPLFPQLPRVICEICPNPPRVAGSEQPVCAEGDISAPLLSCSEGGQAGTNPNARLNNGHTSARKLKHSMELLNSQFYCH